VSGDETQMQRSVRVFSESDLLGLCELDVRIGNFC